MYQNLKVEMAKKDITRADIAELIGEMYETICRKIDGEYVFTLDEAEVIHDVFFSECDFRELFLQTEDIK